MKRAMIIGAWSIAGFFVSLTAFAYAFTAAKVEVSQIGQVASVAVFVGWLAPFIGFLFALIQGLRGKLPGTKK